MVVVPSAIVVSLISVPPVGSVNHPRKYLEGLPLGCPGSLPYRLPETASRVTPLMGLWLAASGFRFA